MQSFCKLRSATLLILSAFWYHQSWYPCGPPFWVRTGSGFSPTLKLGLSVAQYCASLNLWPTESCKDLSCLLCFSGYIKPLGEVIWRVGLSCHCDDYVKHVDMDSLKLSDVISEPIHWGEAVKCFDIFRRCSWGLSCPSGTKCWLQDWHRDHWGGPVLFCFSEESTFLRTPSGCSHKVALRPRALSRWAFGLKRLHVWQEDALWPSPKHMRHWPQLLIWATFMPQLWHFFKSAIYIVINRKWF